MTVCALEIAAVVATTSSQVVKNMSCSCARGVREHANSSFLSARSRRSRRVQVVSAGKMASLSQTRGAMQGSGVWLQHSWYLRRQILQKDVQRRG